MKKCIYKRGYSLIEIVVYLTLFSFIIGVGVVSTFYLIDSIEKVENRGIVLEESNFILQKIYWVVSQAKDIQVIKDESGKYSELNIETYTSENVRLYLEDGFVVVKGETKYFVISNPRYVVDSVVFEVDDKKTVLRVNLKIENSSFLASFILLP